MVTDRFCTAALLAVLAQLYDGNVWFLWLLILDISSHWVQMYRRVRIGDISPSSPHAHATMRERRRAAASALTTQFVRG